MKGLDAKTASDAVKLMVFMVVTSLATGDAGRSRSATSRSAKTDEYKAVFTDVTGLNKGDDVRIAGVRVGTVSEHRRSTSASTRW